MKLKLPKKDTPTLKVSVEGKSYDVNKDNGAVELPNSTPAATLLHLLSMGWILADDSAAKIAQEAGVVLGSDGQPRK